MAGDFLTSFVLIPAPVTCLLLFILQNLNLLNAQVRIHFLHLHFDFSLLTILASTIICACIPSFILYLQLNTVQAQLSQVRRQLDDVMQLAKGINVPVTLDKCLRNQIYGERVSWFSASGVVGPTVTALPIPPVPIAHTVVTSAPSTSHVQAGQGGGGSLGDLLSGTINSLGQLQSSLFKSSRNSKRSPETFATTTATNSNDVDSTNFGSNDSSGNIDESTSPSSSSGGSGAKRVTRSASNK